VPAPDPGVITVDAGSGDFEGEMMAWRNLLWDSVRMLHAGRPDLARRFRTAAGEIEQWLKPLSPDQRHSMRREAGSAGPGG